MSRPAASPRTVGLQAAREAGHILRRRFGQAHRVRYKDTTDLVTEADVESERRVVALIRQHFPEHGILAEEGGTTGTSERRWLIDPLDGTTNYAHGYPFFSVSIAYEVEGELRLGIVYAPVLDELFIAERGAGAYCNGERITVSQTSDLIHSLLTTGFHYRPDLARRNLAAFQRLLGQTQALRRDGSAALDLCYVGAGRFDGYWELGLQAYDTAAGTLIAREACATVTDETGADYRPGAFACVASNGLIHQRLLAVLAEDDDGGAR